MQRQSNNKKWAGGVEAWGAARARKVAMVVERETALREPARRRELERVETQPEMLEKTLAKRRVRQEQASVGTKKMLPATQLERREVCGEAPKAMLPARELEQAWLCLQWLLESGKIDPNKFLVEKGAELNPARSQLETQAETQQAKGLMKSQAEIQQADVQQAKRLMKRLMKSQAKRLMKSQAKGLMKRLEEVLQERLEVNPWTWTPEQLVAWVQALAALVQLLRVQPEAHLVTYDKILAKPKLMGTISSIKPHHRLPLAHRLWPHRQQYWWLIQIIAPIYRLPSELLQQIFLIIIDNASDPPLVLMRVSKLWYNTVTGIWASLKLGTTTTRDAVKSKLKRNQWFLDVVVDAGHVTPSVDAYQAIFAAIQASSRWRSLIVETFPAQADLPEDLVNRGLLQCTNSVMNRLRTFKVRFPCEASPLLDHLLRVLGTSASEDLTIVEINSANVISFLVPTYPSIFRSVIVLSLDVPGLPNPVDLLPHLHQLKTLTASHLLLPIYHNDVDLPFVHTLRHLRLRSVSIQWMSGRTFHALESCAIIFPVHRHVLHTFCTTLPRCRVFSFEGYPLDILRGVSAHKLTQFSVVCSSSYKPRGSQQLARFSSQALQESRLAPRILHISIEATDAAWTKALTFMSNLEELVIHNAQPSSLGVKVLRSLVVHPVYANNLGPTATPGAWNTPVCPSLKRFGLRYRRWLRPNEHFDLIPEFMSIIRTRRESKFFLQSFRLWARSDQKAPLELMKGSWMSDEGFVGLMELKEDVDEDEVW